MAYFANVDADNTITRVIVCESADLAQQLLGGQWVETFITKNYAGKGFIFYNDAKTFVPPQPYASWSLNKGKTAWEPAVAKPPETGTINYDWDETLQIWVLRVEANG